MNRQREEQKHLLLFNLACEEGHYDSLLAIYSKLEQFENINLVT